MLTDREIAARSSHRSQCTALITWRQLIYSTKHQYLSTPPPQQENANNPNTNLNFHSPIYTPLPTSLNSSSHAYTVILRLVNGRILQTSPNNSSSAARR